MASPDASTAASSTATPGRIAWRDGVDDGGLTAAFAQAAAEQRPLFLYWGAAWCPPCNRVKAEIFARDDVAERLRGLLPVYLDGDSAGAQALAAQYQLRSYPTLILFAPDGREITRLPCELDGELFVAALDVALRCASTASLSLQMALSAEPALTADAWSLLAHYSWDTDEGQLLASRDAAATLTALAQACPQPDAAARLALHAQVAGRRPADAGALLAVITDARLARANMDLLNNSGIELIKAAAEGRVELVAALSAVARTWSGDLWLSASDRLTALRLQMRLTRLGAPVADLPEQVRQQVAELLAETSDPYERHTLVNTAVSALHDAGLAQQAEALLLAELPGSHSPYYFMLSLVGSAKRRGDTAGVLNCYEQAAAGATGRATRLQWDTTYLSSLIDLAPHDGARIDAAAATLLRDIAATTDAFQQRNLTQLQRAAAKLAGLPQPGPEAIALSRAIAAGLA